MRENLAAFVFILIWSTGLIVAKGIVGHASPELFLLVRMGLTALVLAASAILAGERWPQGRQIGWHLLAGSLLNGFYLCLAYWAVARGIPAGVMSLMSSTQPLVIAAAAFAFYGERLSVRALAGLAVAILGVCLVIGPLFGSETAHVDILALVAGAMAVVSMAAGTMIQRGACSIDPVRVSAALQNAGGIPVAIVAMLAAGAFHWDDSLPLLGMLAWSVFGLSAAGVLLIVWLTRIHGPTKMSTLLLLVPALAALEARLLFHESLSAGQIAGFALTLIGVMISRSAPRPAATLAADH